MKKFEYFSPTTLQEASELLLSSDNTVLINGGTDVVVRLTEKHIFPDKVISIRGIPGLADIIETDDSVTVGACVPMNEMAHHVAIHDKLRFLSDAVHYLASAQIRNLATMVGNICNASPLADTATPLLAYDAVVLAYSVEGEREIPISEFFTGVRRTSLRKGEIVKAIRIPRPKQAIGEFRKISRRKEVDLSTVCSTIALVDGEYRVAFGSVAPTPLRARKTEEYLMGKKLTDEVIEEAARIATGEVSPIDDLRSSKEYRLEMVALSVRKALQGIRGV